mmetsp:Transcript_9612/g.27754  ORF Transcript_9612/g.27754 Transcript_9612/m.27754 type:complete len:443 (-) Transcript_9612:118-1446(-)
MLVMRVIIMLVGVFLVDILLVVVVDHVVEFAPIFIFLADGGANPVCLVALHSLLGGSHLLVCRPRLLAGKGVVRPQTLPLLIEACRDLRRHLLEDLGAAACSCIGIDRHAALLVSLLSAGGALCGAWVGELDDLLQLEVPMARQMNRMPDGEPDSPDVAGDGQGLCGCVVLDLVAHEVAPVLPELERLGGDVGQMPQQIAHILITVDVKQLLVVAEFRVEVSRDEPLVLGHLLGRPHQLPHATHHTNRRRQTLQPQRRQSLVPILIERRSLKRPLAECGNDHVGTLGHVEGGIKGGGWVDDCDALLLALPRDGRLGPRRQQDGDRLVGSDIVEVRHLTRLEDAPLHRQSIGRPVEGQQHDDLGRRSHSRRRRAHPLVLEDLLPLLLPGLLGHVEPVLLGSGGHGRALDGRPLGGPALLVGWGGRGALERLVSLLEGGTVGVM